jgi:hypothetical protein
MISRWMLCLAAASCLLLAAPRKRAATVPVPADPFEMVPEPNAIDAHPNRTAVLQLLDAVRESYALRRAGRPYDLKVTFKVNSGGQTEYDGTWEMEDMFDPGLGFRWTAKASASYAITGIFSNGMYYGEGAGDHIPLRLQEARAALFDPVSSSTNAARAAIRTSGATFNGKQLTCVLLSDPRSVETAPAGRRWDESEDCIDPQSGLLQLHSQVPGRYYAYDYTDAAHLGDHVLPRKVTVTESGQTVNEILVESLTDLPAADTGLFMPTEEMKARGQPIAMGAAQKILRVSGQSPVAGAAAAAADAVCVFGVVTPGGQLVEAHSLQPADLNSQAAIEAAKQILFPHLTLPGARPAQHFVFVIEKFVTSR